MIVVVLSWPFQCWFVFKATTAFDKYLYSSLAMVMVTVGTFIAGSFVFAKRNPSVKEVFKHAGWHWGKPKKYVAVIAFAQFVWFVPNMIELIFGWHKPIGNIVITQVLVAFLLRFVATLIPAFGEEFGWRGYMLPRLAVQFGPKKGLLIHAFIWWFWHLPVVVGMGIKTAAIGSSFIVNVLILLAITIIPTMLHAVIFAFIWSKTKSLAVVCVYHAAFDEVRDTLENTTGFGPLVEIWQMITIIVVGGLLLWKVNWKIITRNFDVPFDKMAEKHEHGFLKSYRSEI